MILTLAVCFTTSLFLTLPKIKGPLQITLIIIIIALLTASIFSSFISSWYAFLIFLIYVGGILVIFAYFTATSPNQQITSIKKIIRSISINFILSVFIIRKIYAEDIYMPQHQQLITIFIKENIFTLIIITLILLITIVIVVKLSSSSKGPLRTFIT